MMERKRSRRARLTTLGLGTTALAGVVFGLGGGTAGATYAACSGSQIFDVPGMQGFELYDVPGYDVRTFELGFSLVPGRYDITTSSFDGYPGRKDLPVEEQEPSERWWAEFLDADGNVVGALPGPTTDLPDDTDVAEVVDWFEDVELSGTATSVRFVLIRDTSTPIYPGGTAVAGSESSFDVQGQRSGGWGGKGGWDGKDGNGWGGDGGYGDHDGGDEEGDDHPIDEQPDRQRPLNLVHVGCVGFELQQDPPVTTQPETPATTQPAPTTSAPVTVVTTTPTVPSTTTSVVPVIVSPATLPFTGDHTGLLAAIGAGTVAAGAALLLRARRLSA